MQKKKFKKRKDRIKKQREGEKQINEKRLVSVWRFSHSGRVNGWREGSQGPAEAKSFMSTKIFLLDFFPQLRMTSGAHKQKKGKEENLYAYIYTWLSSSE